MKDDSLLSEEWYEVKPGVWVPRRAYWNDPVPSFDDEAGTYSDPKCCTCSPVYVAWPDDHEPLSGPFDAAKARDDANGTAEINYRRGNSGAMTNQLPPAKGAKG